MISKIAYLIIGIAIGIELHRFVVMIIQENFPLTMCDYCKFSNKKPPFEDGFK